LAVEYKGEQQKNILYPRLIAGDAELLQKIVAVYPEKIKDSRTNNNREIVRRIGKVINQSGEPYELVGAPAEGYGLVKIED